MNALRKYRWLAVAALVLTALASLLADMHPHFAIERLPAFDAFFGVLGVSVLVLVARLLVWARSWSDCDDD